MPYQFLTPLDVDQEAKLPPLRWRRGWTMDADHVYHKRMLKMGAVEVSREEAAEITIDEDPAKKTRAHHAKEK